jgi:hypothetical protein
MVVVSSEKEMCSGAILALMTIGAAAQTKVDLTTQAKKIDFSGAASTRPLKTGTTLPPTCNVGELFFSTSSVAGANLFACTTANVWTVQAGNGPGGSVGVALDGTLVGARPTINLSAGTGIQSMVTDTGSQINVQSAVDTAVMQTQAGAQAGGALLCAPASGSATTYSCGLDPTVQVYVTGMLLHWLPDVSAAGGPATLNVDTLGAVPVKMPDGITDPPVGQIQAGQMYPIWYDGRVFRMITGVAAGTAPGPSGVVSATSPVTYNSTTQTVACPNCADRSQSYSDPAWIASLGWTKLTNLPASFTPSAHAAAHGSAGSDPVTLSETQVTNLPSDLAVKAPLASPAFTGAPTAPTQTQGDNSQKLATTAYVDAGLSGKAASNASVTVNGASCSLGSSCTLSSYPGIRRGFGYTFWAGGAALSSGVTGYLTVPFACTISAWNMAVDQGTATVDVWKTATGTAIPTIANSITASATPAISSGTAIHSTTLPGWTTSVALDDIVGVNLKAVASATVVNLTVECVQ